MAIVSRSSFFDERIPSWTGYGIKARSSTSTREAQRGKGLKASQSSQQNKPRKMNLGLADSTVTGAAAAEALRSSGRGSHGLEPAASNVEDSFLVSDDEEELAEESRQHPIKQQSMAKDDYSPIPVRTLQRRSASTLKRNMVKTPSPYKGGFLSESEPKILLPHEGLTSKKTPLGLAIQPRNTPRCFSSNLDGNAAKPSMNLQQLQTTLQPQNLATQQGPRFPRLATTVATAIALAKDSNNSISHNHDHAKRVTFTHQDTAAASTAPQAMTAAPSKTRMRTRSQAIAIQKQNVSAGGNSMDCFHSNDYDSPEDASYNEQLYDSATWRMYHRIVEHRQNQQRYNSSSSNNDSSFTQDDDDYFQASKATVADGASYQGYCAPPPPSAAAGASTMEEDHDDEGIFEMDL